MNRAQVTGLHEAGPQHHWANEPDPVLTGRILGHIRRLSSEIGGRGSCTPQERQAAEYVAGQLAGLGLQNVHLEPFQAIPSTYRPYGLAFSAAAIGTLLALASGATASTGALAFGVAFNVLGLWGMLVETDLAASWVRWLLPKSTSQNALALAPSARPARRTVVLCAHIDSHRTPIFYSSPVWHAAFSLLIGLAFLSMAVGALAFGLAIVFSLNWAHWVGLALLPIQLFALGMCLHADFTPFSPGANDNASGAGVLLALADRLTSAPLAHTRVFMLFTGCEEVGDYGMQAFLDAHATRLDPKTVYIILDEVGSGRIHTLTADGLLIRRKTHPAALALARRVAARHPHLGVVEKVGLAYTDALAATRLGLPAITICTVPDPQSGIVSHWHQMADLPDAIDAPTLQRSFEFAWQLLLEIDRRANS